jgi:tRNA G18 (ribose-2'-O)-methylase SpoU
MQSNVLFSGKDYDKLYESGLARPVIIADSLRNADNIGALIRLGDNIGALAVHLLGDESAVNQSKIRRAAASSYRNIPWSFTGQDNMHTLLPEGYTAVALETSAGAQNIFEADLPGKCALVIGNEQYGIRPVILAQTVMQVYIPVPGPTKSLNVSHAAAVFLFEWLRRQLQS